MEYPDLNELMIKIAKEMKVDSLFLVAGDDKSAACCIGGTVGELTNILANLFEKNPAIIEVVEAAIHVVKQKNKDIIKSIFEC